MRATLLTGFESTSSFTLGCRKNKCPGHGHVKEKGKQRDALANSSLAAVNSSAKISTNDQFYFLRLALFPLELWNGLGKLLANGRERIAKYLIVLRPRRNFLRIIYNYPCTSLPFFP